MSRSTESIRFDSAAEFLAALRRSNPRWLRPKASLVPWVFRGQSNADWALSPSAWRERVHQDHHYRDVLSSIEYSHVSEVIELNRESMEGESPDAERFKRQIAQRRFEYLQVRAFLDMADELGFDVPGGFMSDRIPWRLDPSESTTESLHPGYALAQHHGMPTRFLDWTQNPLIAAFFAAENPANMQGEIAVWALHPLGLFETEWQEYRVPRSTIGFVHAQAGLFTYHRSADTYFVRKGRWPMLEDDCEDGFLFQLTLPSSEASELRRLLFAEGISRAHLMPTFDNIKATLQAHWTDHYEVAAGNLPQKDGDT